MARDKYKVVVIKGKKFMEHRLVWQAVHGPIPAGFELHHINGEHKDNRLENLQLVTPKEHAKIHGCNPVELIDGQLVKKCRACNIQKPVKAFRVHKGSPYFQCYKCVAKLTKGVQRQRYLKRKAALQSVRP